VDNYRRQPPATMSRDTDLDTNTIVEDAGQFLRRLIPFSSSPGASQLPTPLDDLSRDVLSHVAAPAPGVPPIADPAANIISQAASILDAEMAKGVIAARGANSPVKVSQGMQADSAMSQVHELVENISRMWPALQRTAALPQDKTPVSGAGGQDSLPTVKPRSALRRGDRGTISMLVCNRENRSVQLGAAATDLLGTSGARISSARLEFVPAELRLEPGQEAEMQCHITVPADCTPGKYVGVLVVTGVDYLRALIVADVV